MKILVATAWAKYHGGDFIDAYKIAGYLLQEPLISGSQSSPIEYQVLHSEIRLIVLYCQTSQRLHEHLNNMATPHAKNLENLPQFQNQGKDVIENGPIQMGISVMKLTNTLSLHFSSAKCSQEMSRVALSLRTYIISLKAREIMTYLTSWIGMGLEMKMYGKLTIELARQLAISTR